MAIIRVLLVEDNRLLRDGATAILNSQPDIKAVSSATGKGDILKKARELKPHVVLLDIGVSTQNSLKTMRSIRRQHSKTEIIVMDLMPGSSYIVEFVKEGVAGFIQKDATLEDFLTTIRTVAKGKRSFPRPCPTHFSPRSSSTPWRKSIPEGSRMGSASPSASSTLLT